MAEIPIATLTARLEEARTAYHNLTIRGYVKVVVDQNGERVEYGASNSARLAAYIAELERAIGDRTPGPMQFVF